jgi:hypothetical protein
MESTRAADDMLTGQGKAPRYDMAIFDGIYFYIE